MNTQMKMQYSLPVPDLSALHKSAEDPLAVMVAGGTFSRLAEVDEAVACDVLSYVDAKTPLGQRRVGPRVKCQPIANGQTTVTLNRFSGGSLHRMLESGGNWSTADGLNALFEFANVSARFTAENAQNQCEFYAAYADVLRQRGGDDSTLRFTHVGLFGAGGVSGGTGHILQAAECHPYIESAAEVMQVRLRIGPVCHAGCRDDNRIEVNHAAALAVDLSWVLRAHPMSEDEREDRVTRLYYATEFLNCGRNDAKRDHLAATFAQGFLCESFRKKTKVVMCNDNANDAGRIAVLRPGWYQAIDRHKAAQIAYQTYAREVGRLLSVAPAAGAVIGAVKVETERAQNPQAVKFQDLLSLAVGTQASPEALTVLASRSPKKFKAVGTVPLPNETTLKLTELGGHLDNLGPSFSGFKDKMRLVAALRPEIDKKFRQARASQRIARRAFKRQAKSFSLVAAWLFSRVGVKGFVSAVTPLPWKRRLLENTFDKLQAAARQHARTTSVCALLAVVRRRLQFEEYRTKAIIHRVLEALAPFKAKRDAMPPVKMLPIERAWPFLRKLHGGTFVTENRLTLSRLVETVTAYGLKEILSAEDASPEALADALRTTVPEWAPSFGRDATRAYKNRYRVLPPIEPSLRDDIQKHLSEELREMVLYADSCAGGITAVAIDMSTPSPLEKGGLRELFTAAVRGAFRKSLEPKTFRQFYPDEECQAAARWVASELKIPVPAWPNSGSPSNGCAKH